MWNTKEPEQRTLASFFKVMAWILACWTSVVAPKETATVSAR